MAKIFMTSAVIWTPKDPSNLLGDLQTLWITDWSRLKDDENLNISGYFQMEQLLPELEKHRGRIDLEAGQENIDITNTIRVA